VDRFTQMSLFVAVAELASFQKAAHRFEMSPPAVTRCIAALEERLGVKLLHRTTRRVKLTEVGATYLEDCRRILAELEEAEESTNGSYRSPKGLLNVTAPVLFGQLYVLPILLEFLDLYPEVRGRTLFLDRVVNLVDEGLDVALRIGELPDSSLIAIPVGRVRRVVCAAPAYLEKRGAPEHPKDLACHRFVVGVSGLTSVGQVEFREQGKPLRVALAPTLQLNTNASAIQIATSGWGICRVLSYQVAQELASGQLKLLLEDYEPEPWPIYVLHQEGRSVSAKVRAFVDFLAQRLRAHPDLQRVPGIPSR
jgi:DNA-binding transcriptional LysR family regulator